MQSKNPKNDGFEAPEYAEIHVSRLQVDHDYQRPLKKHFVRKLVRIWDDRFCQPLTVHVKDDGEFHVVDGQHRLAAGIEVGKTVMPCLVSVVEEQSEEAKAFVSVNATRQNMTGMDIFRAKLVARDAEALAIAAILERNGVRIAGGPQNRALSAATSLVKAYQCYGPAALEYAVRTILKAYGGEGGTIVGFLIVAIARFHARFSLTPAFDSDRLARVLAPVPLADLRRMTAARSPRGLLVAEGAAYVLADLYNTRLGEAKRLADGALSANGASKGVWESLSPEEREAKKRVMTNAAIQGGAPRAALREPPRTMPLSARGRIAERMAQRAI